MKMIVIRSSLRTLFLFAFAGWIYIALNAVFHPETLAMPLTHLFPYPREDTFGIICFAVSFISYFFLNIVKEDKK